MENRHKIQFWKTNGKPLFWAPGPMGAFEGPFEDLLKTLKTF